MTDNYSAYPLERGLDEKNMAIRNNELKHFMFTLIKQIGFCKKTLQRWKRNFPEKSEHPPMDV
jgi:hypothetical protein